MQSGGSELQTELGAGVAATGYLLLLLLLLSAKLLPRWCWCWLCSRFDCKSRKGKRLRMDEEMQGGEGDTGWRKAIPEARDRLQSKWLLGVVGALLVWETTSVHPQIYFLWDTDRTAALILIAKIVGISIAFAWLVSALRAATWGG